MSTATHGTRSASGAGDADGAAAALGGVLAGILDRPLGRAAEAATVQRLLHALGVGLSSTRLEPFAVSRAALEDETGPATVLGSTRTAAAGAAAFVNAVALHSSLQEDCGPGGYRDGSHPGVYIVPAAIAAAESIGASGDRLLHGIAVGYEAANRIGASVPPGLVARRFRPVGVVGPFGAAAAAAAILAGDRGTIGRAIAFASNLSSGTSQGFVPGSMEPYFHAGFSARDGLLAARLAASGAPAAADALEGPHGFFAVYGGEPGLLDALTAPQDHLAIEALGSKKYAACLQNQETLELATELAEAVDASRIRSAVLERPNSGANGTASPGVGSEPPYSTMLQRQMSARYTAAAALLRRDVRDPFFFREADADVDALAARIALRTTDGDDIGLTVELDAGAAQVSGRRGSILFPSHEETAALFLTRAATVLGEEGASQARTLIERLPVLDDVRELTVALRG